MANIFHYTISSGGLFPNKKVDLPRFTKEIRESAIPIALDTVVIEDGDCVVTFKNDLTDEEVLLLEALVFAHSGAPLPASPTQVQLTGIPIQSDGSPYFSPCMFPTGVYLYITGADDSEVPFKAESEAAGDVSQDFSFNDWVLIAGGGMIFQGAAIGDSATVVVFCPATPVVLNPSNTGNCNVVSGVIVPAAGNGAYDVNLANVNPVLTPLHDGYWDWNFPITGKGTVVPGVPGAAGAHLIAADYSLIRFVNKAPMLGSGSLDFTIPAIEPKICLPHWKIRVTLHNGGHTGLKAVWHLTTARVKTI